MNRGKVLYVACAALVAGLLVSPASAAGQGAEPRSAGRGAPGILSGQLTDAKGFGVPASSPLTMYVWPSNKVLAALKVGETARLEPIGNTTTDGAGNFTFTGLDLARRSEGEPVNVTVVGSSSAGEYRYATTIDPTSPLADMRVDASGAVAAAVAVKPVAVPGAMAAGSAGFCGTTVAAIYREVPAQVGATFVHAAGASSRYRFTAGASTTLGVGTSGEGRYGTFEAGGTSSLTSDFSINFPTTKKGAYFHQAYVIPKKLKNTCYTPDGVPYTFWYEVRATSYAGGGNTVKGTSFKTTKHCTGLGKGHTWEKNTTTAITWTGGLQTGRVIGLNLSSRSGFTNQSKVVINPGSKDRWICGHHTLPGVVEGLGPRSIKVIPR